MALAISTPARADTVELHAHLFMKEGMTWAFRGDFFGPLQATSWQDKFSSQANPEALEKSGLSIVVATLYAHPLFTLSLRDSIRRQIALARKFALETPNWVLATEPDQAEEALAQGKHVMILALEGASGILETDDDIKEFVDEGGIRIVGPLHLTDDAFGGVAFLRGWHVLSDPIAWLVETFKRSFQNHSKEDSVLTNEKGLTQEGKGIIKKLLEHHVWIDLAHASDASMKQMIEIIEPYHQPLIYTHAVLRKYHHAERGITEEIIKEINRTGGILGLMPSEEYLEGAPTSADCPSSIYGLSEEYKEVAAILGSDSIMMGSDYNGGLPHLRPGCHTGTSLDSEGLWNMGQIPELWSGLKALGAPVPSPLSKMADRFVATWKKVRN
jgi:microsomal dipeptidase-like Zn-dependent dipeptidase